MGKAFLVPIDGSPSSVQAIDFALTMVKPDDEIFILNVQKPQYEGLERVSNVSKEKLDRFYHEEGNRILELAMEGIKEQDIQINTMIRIGLPSIEIAKAAKELTCHSIIMGSKGMSPVVNNALGSVTYGVIHLASCPVTVVPFVE